MLKIFYPILCPFFNSTSPSGHAPSQPSAAANETDSGGGGPAKAIHMREETETGPS